MLELELDILSNKEQGTLHRSGLGLNPAQGTSSRSMPAPSIHSLMPPQDVNEGDALVKAQARGAQARRPRYQGTTAAVPTATEPTTNPYQPLISDTAQRSDDAPSTSGVTIPSNPQRPTSEASTSVQRVDSIGPSVPGNVGYPGRTPNPSPATSSALDVNAPAFVPVSKPVVSAQRGAGSVRPPPHKLGKGLYGFGGGNGLPVVAPADLDPRRKAVYQKLHDLVRARTMAEHKQALSAFSDHINWDVPPLLVHDREQMRVIVYLAKFAADLDFTLEAISVESLPDGREVLHTLLTFHNTLKRPWWTYPAAFVLPSRIDIKATVNITTAPIPGGGDEIQAIWGRIHNAPAFPDLIRHFNAFGMGTLGKLSEPLWSQAMWLCGDNSYSNGAADRVAGYNSGAAGYSGSGAGLGTGGSGYGGAVAGFGPKSGAAGFEVVGQDPGGADGVPYQRM